MSGADNSVAVLTVASIAAGVVAAVLCVFELWLYRNLKRGEYLSVAFISASTSAYALAQAMLVEGPVWWAWQMVAIQYMCIIVLAAVIPIFTGSYVGEPVKRCTRYILFAISGLWIALLLGTDLLISDNWVMVGDQVMARQRMQPKMGPLFLVMAGQAFVTALWAAVRIIQHRRKRGEVSLLFPAGLAWWIMMSLYDILKLVFPVPNLASTMEFGLLGFALATFGIHVEQSIRDADEATKAALTEAERARLAVENEEIRHQAAVLQAHNARLEELDQLKSVFVSTISHELRTPLTSMRGAIGLLLSGKVAPVDDKALPLLRMADANCTRLERLVNDILDIDGLESGSVALHRKATRAATWWSDVAAQLKANYETGQAPISVFSAVSDEARVDLDTERMRSAIGHLLDNAVKFTPPGVCIELSAETTADGGLRVVVRDEGPGIPENVQAHLFERFVIGEGADQDHKGGVGLGLSLVRAIVRGHGGTLTLDSTPDSGTTVAFMLPASRVPAPASAAA